MTQTLEPETRDFLAANGFTVKDEARWVAALTHGSMGETRDYERLEFLGDRVLGLSIADWLFGTSDLNRGVLGHLFNGCSTAHVKQKQRKIIGATDDPQAGVARAETSLP